MAIESAANVLALVSDGMKLSIGNLEAATPGPLTVCNNATSFALRSREKTYAVTLLPAENFSPHDWWNIWGTVRALEPQPAILVYAPVSDFQMWAGVLDAGGFDVIVAPFTEAKLRTALASALADYVFRTKTASP